MSAMDTVREHTGDLHTLKARVKALESCAEDTENQNRRNNLRIIDLPEGSKGTDPTAFTEHLLRELLPRVRFSPFFTIEKARRIPATHGPQGSHINLQAPAL